MSSLCALVPAFALGTHVSWYVGQKLVIVLEKRTLAPQRGVLLANRLIDGIRIFLHFTSGLQRVSSMMSLGNQDEDAEGDEEDGVQATSDVDEDFEEQQQKGKRGRERSESPDFFLYFAKSEEATHLDPVLHGLEQRSVQTFESTSATIYKAGEILLGVIAGSQQGSGFYFDFVNFMSRVRPRAVIMCGICAGLGDCKRGDVAVGTSSVLMQGKIERLDLSGLDLEPCDPASTNASAALWVGLGSDVHVGTFLQSPFVLGFSLDVFQQRLQAAYRKLVAIDMESWFYLNSQKRLQHPTILPVVKGISDKGAGKDDSFHKAAVNNSVRIAIEILQRLSKLETNPPLLTHGHSISTADVKLKRSKSSKPAVLTRTAATRMLRDAITDEPTLLQDLKALDTALKKAAWSTMGKRKFADVRNYFSSTAQEVFEKFFA